jgi:hypothetical protein
MNKTLQDDNIGFSIMGLVAGGCFSPLVFPLWNLCVGIWESRNLLEFIHPETITPTVFLLPILVFLGAIVGGLITGNRTLTVTNKRANAIFSAALGGVLGTILAGLLFTMLMLENIAC